jgi:hypothetical protein
MTLLDDGRRARADPRSFERTFSIRRRYTSRWLYSIFGTTIGE